MTLRLTQCHQNWLTIMEHPANFEDRSLWKYNALSLKNHNLIAVPSGSTENRYGVEPLTDSSCPYFSRVKSRISYVDRGHPKDCVNLQCGIELTNILLQRQLLTKLVLSHINPFAVKRDSYFALLLNNVLFVAPSRLVSNVC